MEKQGGGAGIKGRLSEINLIDWMQTLEQGRKTCVLMLRSGDEECTLYFRDGQVYHAVCGELKGNSAVFKILAWADGAGEHLDIGADNSLGELDEGRTVLGVTAPAVAIASTRFAPIVIHKAR